MKDQIVEWAKELQSLAQAGLFYGKDVFDQERYQRIREIAAEMMAARTEIPSEKITGYECKAVGGSFIPNIETSESRYISLDELPPLAEEKCSEEQVRMCFEACGNDNWKVQFD